MSIHKSLLLFFACALIAPVSSTAIAKRSAADQRLFEKARKVCSGPEYPSGTRAHINYAKGWFRCVEPEWKDLSEESKSN
jgi:hypothetical protein